MSTASESPQTAELAPILRRRKVEEAEMDITPMIDVTFLLLIFFMVASKIDVQADVRLPVANYAKPVALGDAVIITVSDDGPDGTAIIYKGDSKDPAARLRSVDPQEQEEEIAAYVQETMVKERKHFVVIKAAKTVKHRDVARVANAVGKAESVQALHVAVMEES
ncbi:MAG: biopolymer transporter ExbD [Pirellulaceae bacterium]|nr:MAG: biopolymer transporter ExbD [Pirellulaceae bacterium]